MNVTSQKLNSQVRTVQLCRWTYGALPDSDKVEIFVSVQPETLGPGYGLLIEYQAFAFEFTGSGLDGQGVAKELWLNRHVEQFVGVPQATVQAQVALGLDPLFERYKADAVFQATFDQKFSRLASKYQKIMFASAVPAPVAVKLWTAI